MNLFNNLASSHRLQSQCATPFGHLAVAALRLAAGLASVRTLCESGCESSSLLPAQWRASLPSEDGADWRFQQSRAILYCSIAVPLLSADGHCGPSQRCKAAQSSNSPCRTGELRSHQASKPCLRPHHARHSVAEARPSSSNRLAPFKTDLNLFLTIASAHSFAASREGFSLLRVIAAARAQLRARQTLENPCTVPDICLQSLPSP